MLEIQADIKIMKPQIQTIKNDIQTLDQKFSVRMDNLKSNVTQHEARIVKLETNVDTLKTINSKQTDKYEFYTKAKQAILFSSVIDSSATTFFEKTRSILKSIGTPDQIVNFIDISKLGKNKNVALLSFQTITIKSALFRIIKDWNHEEENERIYLNDFLTEKKLEIFKKLRKLRAEKKIHSVYSFKNQIYIKVDKEGDSILIRSMDEINQHVQ